MAESDLPFLRRLYDSTRAAEMEILDWTDAQKEEFLGMQFQAQHTFYQEHFPDAEYSVVEKEGAAIGRLYLDRREDEHRLIDIALLPECRRSGLGGALMEKVLGEAREAGKLVRIHVERNNPAMRLYDRLGFVNVEDQGVYYLMEWRPDGSPEASSESADAR